MDVEFKVEQNCSGILTITGETVYSDSESYLNFLYKDSITINIITLEEMNNNLFVAVTYDTHFGELDETHIPLSKDGLYNITLLVVPSLDWYNREKVKSNNNFFRYDLIYVSDGKNLYKVDNSEVINIDPTDFIPNISLNRTTISKNLKKVFLTCFLWICYISLAKEILQDLIKSNNNSGRIFNCGYENEELKDKIYRRDFVWATINIINYLVDKCKLEEAQLILEEIRSCNGFCNFSNVSNTHSFFYNNFNTNYKIDCGCNK